VRQLVSIGDITDNLSKAGCGFGSSHARIAKAAQLQSGLIMGIAKTENVALGRHVACA